MTESQTVVVMSLVVAALGLAVGTMYVRRSNPGWTPSIAIVAAVLGVVILLGLLASLVGRWAGLLLLAVPVIALGYLLITQPRRVAPARVSGGINQRFLLLCVLGTALGIGLMIVALGARR